MVSGILCPSCALWPEAEFVLVSGLLPTLGAHLGLRGAGLVPLSQGPFPGPWWLSQTCFYEGILSYLLVIQMFVGQITGHRQFLSALPPSDACVTQQPHLQCLCGRRTELSPSPVILWVKEHTYISMLVAGLHSFLSIESKI